MLQRKLRFFYSTVLIIAGGVTVWLLVHPKNLMELMRPFNKEDLVNSQPMVAQGSGEAQISTSLTKKKFMEGMRVAKKWTEKSFPVLMSNCSYVKDLFANRLHVSQTEENFPLAFLMTIHDRSWQVVRLLTTVYRPHNVYCVHVDSKASPLLIDGFRHISACLGNVVVPERLVEVVYKFGSSIMEAQLSCWESLLGLQAAWKWRYVINLCGTELPYLTNKEITCALMSAEGSSIFQYYNISDKEKSKRFQYKVELNPASGKLERGRHLLGPLPHDIKLYKASTYMAASSAFVHFALTNQKARDLRKYMKDVISPEEHFYISLYFLPEAPKGSNVANRNIVVSKSFWDLHCSMSIHLVCILGMEELDRIHSYAQGGRTVFFFNKYLTDHDSAIMDYMQGVLMSKNMHEFQTGCHGENLAVAV